MPPPIEGWKNIAEYLGRGTRTVQLWERNHGLPVHRLQKRVLAYPHELDEWRRRHTEIADLAELDPPEPAADDPIPPPPTFRKLRPHLYIAGILLVAAAFAIAKFRRPPQPVSFHISGNTLIVTGPGEVELWRYTSPDPISEVELSGEARSRIVFADLDGDGTLSTLFQYVRSYPPRYDYLLCFDPRGNIRWKFVPGHEIRDAAGRDYTPPFAISAFAPVRGAKSKHANVVVSSNHFWSYPDQVALLDGITGRLLSEYWHRGHVLHLAVADLDGDGEPEVLLGGVNDAPEYARATLLVFDHRRISGSARKPDGSPYFPALGPGSEKAIVRFPRSLLSKDQAFNRVKRVESNHARVTVIVSEGVSEHQSCIVYELDAKLTPVMTALCDDSSPGSYQALFSRNPRLEPPTVYARRLQDLIEVQKFGW